MDYPWYEIIESSRDLEQGDFLPSWVVPMPKELTAGTGRIKADGVKYDVIVMSQTCDIAFKKIDLALLCPMIDLDEMGTDYKNPGNRERLRRGEVVGYHMLNKCDLREISDKCGMSEYFNKYLIIDFRNAISFPLEILIEGARARKDYRLRLLPPNGEHLSQAFARFIMRVGLPRDIPKFS